LLVIAALGGYSMLHLERFLPAEKYQLIRHFFEDSNPQVQIINPPPGFGTSTISLELLLTDQGAGLDEIIVRTEQNTVSKEIFHKRYVDRVVEEKVSININAKELKLAPGMVKINIALFDKSFWSNTEKLSQDFVVRYDIPKLSALSIQHNGVIGGSELIFYLIENFNDDPAGYQSGVESGGRRFYGLPAKLIDPVFEKRPNLYFAFFGFPLTFADNARLFVVNQVLNTAYSNFYYKAQRNPKRGVRYSFNKNFDQQALEAELKITELTSKISTTNYWSSNFLRPPGMATRIDFGEKVDDQPLNGVVLVAHSNTQIVAQNDGVTVFAGDLPYYGKVVILDHGFGVSSLYGSLSSIKVKVGDKLLRGDELGASGSTGFFDFDHLYTEVRVQGLAVRPIEWWDERWMRDHFLAKIKDIQSLTH
jgi:murein DD-endopeptidase MepM/ murein hydrolase activator NlpD